MRSSSSELLIDQQQELRRRKLLELAHPKKREGQRSCREKVWFYTTSFLTLTAVSAGSSLLFLVPLYVDPAISTLAADFEVEPVRCVTTRQEELKGIFNCTWSSCREGCTSDMFQCVHIYVSYWTIPYHVNQNYTKTLPTPSPNFTEEAILLVNIKGCGYPPRVKCQNFTDVYGAVNSEFPCYYSRENRTVVLSQYDHDEHVAVIIHYFAVPFIVTVATSVALCVMYCDCRCSSPRSRRRRRRRHSRKGVEDASENSASTRVDMLTPHADILQPI